MEYCPICSEELKPGTVCACGWDPSCDYENYLSLVPAPSGTRSTAALREAFAEQKVEAQKKADEARFEQLQKKYDAKIEELETRLKLNEEKVVRLNRKIQRILSGSITLPNEVSAAASSEEQNSERLTAQLKYAEIGDEIMFGQYWQDESRDDDKSDIWWKILDKDDTGALLISKYGLVVKKFNTEKKNITWEDCTLKQWLNGEFLTEAFTLEQQWRIRFTPAGNVFLLSLREAAEYFASDEDRVCKPTAYANAQGECISSSTGNCWWWLRSPGMTQKYAANVDCNGSVNSNGCDVDKDFLCVRPALWISLEEDTTSFLKKLLMRGRT